MGTTVLGVFVAWGALLLAYRTSLRRLWREPVFKMPVIVLESDDWGAGPQAQAVAMNRLCMLLRQFRDDRGNPPVMTIGLVLACAEHSMPVAGESETFPTVDLDDPRQRDVLAALEQGCREGVFVLQLHGMSHFWEANLMAAVEADEAVREWLRLGESGWTEELPSPLQSRWLDVRTLPSKALPTMDIEAAVIAEVSTWRRIFRRTPSVVVPTTFIWNQDVESAYSRAGLRALITPGHRCESRDLNGRPVPLPGQILNGERGQSGLMYLVRDVYFEPVAGHPATRLAEAALARAALGRPALVEMHRFNFCGPRSNEAAWSTLEAALTHLQERCPRVRFAASEQLVDSIEALDPDWIETRFSTRLAIWARRALELPRFRRLARWSGLALPLCLVARFA